ncbi:hypothetical protein KJ780_04885 [Candidatus Micrarchaeota archaeon]|nr:hypothetical protein [Candidatus Micrarchaeota archaeon]
MVFIPKYIPMMDEICTASPDVTKIFFLPDWAVLSLMAIIFSVFAMAFFYMLAMIFQNQQAIAALKLEFYEILVTAVIFVAIAMLLSSTCTIKTGDFFPKAGKTNLGGSIESWADKSIYDSSTNFLIDFADKTLVTMEGQYKVYVLLDAVTSMEIASVPMGVGANARPTAGLGAAIKPVMNNALSAETIAVVTMQGLAYTIDYLSFGFLKYFLPIGLFLRSFIITRRIGGTLIALTVIFLFIVPLLIIPTYTVVNQQFQSKIDYFKDFRTAVLPDSMDIVTAGLRTLVLSALKLFWAPDLLMLYTLSVIPAIAYIFLGGVFFPIFLTIVLTSTARYISKALGEEIDITNLTRMI